MLKLFVALSGAMLNFLVGLAVANVFVDLFSGFRPRPEFTQQSAPSG
jgi:hypothetical protein